MDYLPLLILFAPSLLVFLFIPSCPSRRLLCLVMAWSIPLVGVLLAYIVCRVEGEGIELEEPEVERAERYMSVEDIHSLGDMPPLLERLMSKDPTERLAALVGLSRKADADTIDLLRYTIEHGRPEAVLDAALTLEEIDLRRDRELDEAMKKAEQTPNAETALAAADAATDTILCRLADPAMVPVLAEQARKYYRLASELDPGLRQLVDERMARMELGAVRPREALALLDGLVADRGDEADDELLELRAHAQFAARDFAPARPYTAEHSDSRQQSLYM